MLGVNLNDVKIKKCNSLAICKKCKKQNIFYNRLNGYYVYYCLNCKKWLKTGLYDNEVLIKTK